MPLFIELVLQSALDLGYLLSAEVVLYPADHHLLGEIRKRDQLVGALEADRSIGRAGIGAIFSRERPVCRQNESIGGLPLKIRDPPGEGGARGSAGHGNASRGVNLSNLRQFVLLCGIAIMLKNYLAGVASPSRHLRYRDASLDPMADRSVPAVIRTVVV